MSRNTSSDLKEQLIWINSTLHLLICKWISKKNDLYLHKWRRRKLQTILRMMQILWYNIKTAMVSSCQLDHIVLISTLTNISCVLCSYIYNTATPTQPLNEMSRITGLSLSFKNQFKIWIKLELQLKWSCFKSPTKTGTTSLIVPGKVPLQNAEQLNCFHKRRQNYIRKIFWVLKLIQLQYYKICPGNTAFY